MGQAQCWPDAAVCEVSIWSGLTLMTGTEFVPKVLECVLQLRREKSRGRVSNPGERHEGESSGF